MSVTKGMHSYGTTLAYALSYTVPGSGPDVFQLIGEIRNIHGTDIEIGDTNMTSLTSNDKMKEFIPAFGDGDVVTFTLNYEKSQMALLMGLLPTGQNTYPDYGRKRWEIILPDASTMKFIAYVKKVGLEVPEDDKISIDVTLKVSFLPVFTPSA